VPNHFKDPKPDKEARIVYGPGSGQAAGTEMIPPGGVNDRDGVDPRVRKEIKIVRLGKRWSELLQRVEDGETTWAEIASSLTPVELARGQIMDKNGRFTGRPPSMVPRAFFDACIRELLNRGSTLYKENYVDCIKAMTEIATTDGAKAADRIKAAQFVIERLEGKVPDRLEVHAVDDPWQGLISGAVAEVAEEQAIANAHEYLNRRAQPQVADDDG